MRTKQSMETRLPVELLEDVFREAAAQQLDTSPRNAAALQLISRETRDWVLPILFSVLVVHFPPFYSPQTPSLKFFCHLIDNPSAAPRAHVRHLMIITSIVARLNEFWEPANLVPWKLDSIVYENQALQLIECIWMLQLIPECMFLHPSTEFRLHGLIFALWSPSPVLPITFKGLHAGWPKLSEASAPSDQPSAVAQQHRGISRIFLEQSRTLRAIPTFLHTSRDLSSSSSGHSRIRTSPTSNASWSSCSTVHLCE